MVRKQLPEGYDPVKILKKAIDLSSKKDFEERYNLLFSLYFDSLSDYEKPKDEQKFFPDLNKIIRPLFLDDNELVDMSRERIYKYKIHRNCSSCGVDFPPDPIDYYISKHGVRVKFLCNPCKVAKKNKT